MLEPSTEMGMAAAVTWADRKPLPSWVTFQGWGTQDKGVHVRSLPPHCREAGSRPFDFWVSFQQGWCLCRMISEAVGAMASCFCSLLPRELSTPQSRAPLGITARSPPAVPGMLKASGKAWYRWKTKSQTKKACFPPLGHSSHYYSPLLPLSSQTGGTLWFFLL